MANEGIEDDIRVLREQMAELQEVLRGLARPYGDRVAEYVERLRSVTRGYLRLLDLYRKHGAVSPDVIVPGLRDPISREIVRILFEAGDRNISQIADALKERRGTASRRIVRERLAELEARGVVVSRAGSRARTFSVSDRLVSTWREVLGLEPARTDRPRGR